MKGDGGEGRGVAGKREDRRHGRQEIDFAGARSMRDRESPAKCRRPAGDVGLIKLGKVGRALRYADSFPPGPVACLDEGTVGAIGLIANDCAADSFHRPYAESRAQSLLRNLQEASAASSFRSFTPFPFTSETDSFTDNY